MAERLTGRFCDVANLDYRTTTVTGATSITGRTDAKGEFEYRAGEEVTFSIGNYFISKTTAKEVITISDCAERDEDGADGTFLHRARVLFSLTNGQGFENGGVVITDEVNIIILFAFQSS